MSETSGELGGALGIAILGSIGTAVYRTGVAESLPGGYRPRCGRGARHARWRAGDRADAADAVGAALVDVARIAFIDALHFVAAVAAVGAILAAIAAAIALRSVNARSEPASENGTPEPIGATD